MAMIKKILEKYFKIGLNSDLKSEAGKYWSSSADNPQIRDHSHWAGEGRWADLDMWEGIGRGHLKYYEELCTCADRRIGGDSMLEWGPGGGSNILSFSPLFKKVYGVDISAANLDKCEEYMIKRGVGNFIPILIDASSPEEFSNSIKEPLDFFLSTAVFQHFPSKDYGFKIIELAYASLRPGGYALVQTRFDNNNNIFKSKNANYYENVMTFTSYTIDEFWDEASNVGFETISIKLDTKVNYSFYLMRKPTAV